MAGHTLVDLALVLHAAPHVLPSDRLSQKDFHLVRSLVDREIPVRNIHQSESQLHGLRRMYEPYVFSLSERLLMPLPPLASKVPGTGQLADQRVGHGRSREITFLTPFFSQSICLTLNGFLHNLALCNNVSTNPFLI